MIKKFGLISVITLSLFGKEEVAIPIPTQGEVMKPLISSDEISRRIASMGRRLSKEYDDLTIVMIMKGSLLFVSDLMRKITIPTTLEYIRCHSYRDNKRGELVIDNLDDLDLKGKHVLIVDDIIDSGETLGNVYQALSAKGAASLKSLVLLSKTVNRSFEYDPDYVLFEIDDKFVLGYGLDYDEYCRGLPEIYYVNLE